NRMYAAVIARLLERPRTPHCFDRAPQLFGGICRKWCAGLVTDYRLELFGEITQCVLTQLRVAFDSCGHALGSEQVLERAGRHAEYYIGVHLDESAIRIVREACTAARSREYGNRPIVETEIEDGLHHARHRDRGARTYGDKQRVARVSELLSRCCFEARYVRRDFRAQLRRTGAVFQIGDALGRCDSEAGRYGNAEIGHLGEIGPLAAQCALHVFRTFGRTSAEEEDFLRHVSSRSRTGACPDRSGVVSDSRRRNRRDRTLPVRLEPR